MKRTKLIRRLLPWLLTVCLCAPAALALPPDAGTDPALLTLLPETGAEPADSAAAPDAGSGASSPDSVPDPAEALDYDWEEALREEIRAFRETYHADFLLLDLHTEQYAPTALSDTAERYYLDYSYGYEDTGDGFAAAFDVDTGELVLRGFGAAAGWVPEHYLRFAEENASAYNEDHVVFGVLYRGFLFIQKYLEEHPPAQGPARVGEGSSLPAWYPVETQNFPFYHDETAKRVVDSADIFSDAEEQRMEARLAELRSELDKDIVIYTDKSAYGLGHETCAMDFYDFNGYGCGDDWEGACLFICMDPQDRGWWCSCFGPVTQGLYTEDIANQLDDALYAYMAAGNYGAGVADWIENFRTLYVKGSPFAPDWYPAVGESLTRNRNSASPRVVDETGLLHDAQIRALTEQLEPIAQKYGIDVAIHLCAYPTGINWSEFNENYYTYRGYGYGDNYDGILLTVFCEDGYYSSCLLTTYGKGAERLSAVNKERMLARCKDKVDDGDAASALSGWLKDLEHMERTGRVARSFAYWLWMGILSLLAGSVVGSFLLARASSKMQTVKTRANADAYLDEAASVIRNLGDRLLHVSTSRRYIAPPKSSSGGGGGGGSHRSSYSSSSRGSSGRSHSGSGRRF